MQVDDVWCFPTTYLVTHFNNKKFFKFECKKILSYFDVCGSFLAFGSSSLISLILCVIGCTDKLRVVVAMSNGESDIIGLRRLKFEKFFVAFTLAERVLKNI